MTTISLTFDDALEEHLDSAVPILEKCGLHGTFYTNLNSSCFAKRLCEWQRIAASGHELGNHTLFHPAVSSKSYISEGNALEGYTLDRMRIELETANNLLAAVTGRPVRTFAFPCSNPTLGRPGMAKRFVRISGLQYTRVASWVHRHRWVDIGSSERDYTGLLPAFFHAARRGGFDPFRSWPESTPRYAVPCIEGDGRTGDALERIVDLAIENGRWTVFSFHGIGGGHRLSCEREAFERFVARLATERSVAVKTFYEAAREMWPEAAAGS